MGGPYSDIILNELRTNISNLVFSNIVRYNFNSSNVTMWCNAAMWCYMFQLRTSRLMLKSNRDMEIVNWNVLIVTTFAGETVGHWKQFWLFNFLRIAQNITGDVNHGHPLINPAHPCVHKILRRLSFLSLWYCPVRLALPPLPTTTQPSIAEVPITTISFYKPFNAISHYVCSCLNHTAPSHDPHILCILSSN